MEAHLIASPSICIEHDGKIHIFKNTTNMPMCVFREWCKFKAQTSASDAIADIWINKKILGVKYDSRVESILQKYITSGL